VQPPCLASSASEARSDNISACLSESRTLGSSFAKVTTRYSTCGKERWWLAPAKPKRRQMSKLKRSELPRHPTAKHLALSLWPCSRSPRVATQVARHAVVSFRSLLVAGRSQHRQTLIPHSLTWCARFFASGHSSAVPKALSVYEINFSSLSCFRRLDSNSQETHLHTRMRRVKLDCCRRKPHVFTYEVNDNKQS
jgi:hypothetical protein